MRSKEEILGPAAYSHECGSFIEVDTRQEVLKAMDTYAAQSVAEFKERLKEAIRYDLTISMEDTDKFITIIDETK